MMHDQTFYLAHYTDRLSYYLQAGHMQHAKQYFDQLPQQVQQHLQAWLATAIPSLDVDAQQLPTAAYAALQGWRAYYQHHYLEAHQYFTEAIQHSNWHSISPNIALGLCKVYTRTGHWHSARQWALYYLDLARQHLHHFDVAKGYGALAEIFLRANHPQHALACFQTAYHLMPVGHGQHARQLNFMASALIRNGEYSRAEDLLHESRQISRQQLQKDPNDPDASLSFLHATMRFCWLHMLRSGKYQHVLADEFAADMLKGIKTKTGLEAMPWGMMRLAYGASCLVNQDHASAQQQLEFARDAFSPKMLMEYQWALCLLQQCDKQNAVNQQHLISHQSCINAVLALNVVHPPAYDTVVDQTWNLPQMNDQGFAPLFLQHENTAELIALWHLFFI